MKRLALISVSIVLLTNLIYSQDIINETGTDGKFIVRDNQQKEALIIEDGNIDITGTISIDSLAAGSTEDKVVVWSEEDKQFKALYNMIPKTTIDASIMAADSWTESGGNIYRATGNVGIGTTTPAFPLDIKPTSSGAAQLMRESDSDNYAINLKSLTNRGEILLYKNGVPTTKLTGFGKTYFNGGNVGIGTANPISKLSVGGDGDVFATLFAESTTGNAIKGETSMSNSSAVYGKATAIDGRGVQGYVSGNEGIGVFGLAENTGDLYHIGGLFRATGSVGRGVYGWASHSSGVNYGVRGKTASPNGWAGYFEGRGYFEGYVGIGTSTPAQKLQIASGNISMDDNWGIFWGGTLAGIYGSNAGGYLRFKTTGADAMILTSSGSVGIGTITPYEALHVNGKIRSDTGFNSNNSDGVTGTWNFYNDGTSGNVIQIVISGGIVTDITTEP